MKTNLFGHIIRLNTDSHLHEVFVLDTQFVSDGYFVPNLKYKFGHRLHGLVIDDIGGYRYAGYRGTAEGFKSSPF